MGLATLVARLLRAPSHLHASSRRVVPRGLPSCAAVAAPPRRPPPGAAPQRGTGSDRYRTPALGSPTAPRAPRRRPPQLPNCAASACLPPSRRWMRTLRAGGMASHWRKWGIVRAIRGRKGGGSTAAAQAYNGAMEAIMNEDVFNGSIRKFLKTLGVSAQREIEKAVRQALAEGRLKGNEKFPARARVRLWGTGSSTRTRGETGLEGGGPSMPGAGRRPRPVNPPPRRWP